MSNNDLIKALTSKEPTRAERVLNRFNNPSHEKARPVDPNAVLPPPRGTSHYLWKQVILAANLIWRTTGVQPTASQIRITLKAEFPLKSIAQAIETDEFAVEMNRCGIPWHTDLAALDSRQMAALIEVSNPLNTTPLNQKLTKLGVTQHEWTAWKKNPTFQQKLNQLTFELAENYRPEIDALVMARSLEGNLSYISYMDARNKALNEELTQASYNQKIKVFLASVFNALSEELADQPELLAKVASRLNSIQALNQGAPQ